MEARYRARLQRFNGESASQRRQVGIRTSQGFVQLGLQQDGDIARADLGFANLFVIARQQQVAEQKDDQREDRRQQHHWRSAAPFHDLGPVCHGKSVTSVLEKDKPHTSYLSRTMLLGDICQFSHLP